MRVMPVILKYLIYSLLTLGFPSHLNIFILAQSPIYPVNCTVGEYDCRNIQTPLDIDTNRFSDGTSSSSSTTVTSPAFSTYFGPEDGTLLNNSEHMLLLSLNAESQGIALPGEGDARIEDARLSVPPNTPRPTKVFNVSASRLWNPSGFMVQNGQEYNISVLEPRVWYDGNIASDGSGYLAYYDAVLDCFVAQGQCYSYLKMTPRFPKVPWFALLCTIGNYYQLVGEVQPGNELSATYINVDEAQLNVNLFYVGNGITVLANHTGELICCTNDAYGLYWNNKGSLAVSVTRLTWPVSNDSYYRDNYIPSCDSALATYNPNASCNPNLDEAEINLWHS